MSWWSFVLFHMSTFLNKIDLKNWKYELTLSITIKYKIWRDWTRENLIWNICSMETFSLKYFSSHRRIVFLLSTFFKNYTLLIFILHACLGTCMTSPMVLIFLSLNRYLSPQGFYYYFKNTNNKEQIYVYVIRTWKIIKSI